MAPPHKEYKEVTMAAAQFFASEALTVSSTSVGFTAATFAGADYAHVYVDIADVRFRVDGGTASTTNGVPVAVHDEIILESVEEVARFRAIRDGGTDATLFAQFGKRT